LTLMCILKKKNKLHYHANEIGHFWRCNFDILFQEERAEI
jgi:hypothetical protein